ncbi:MAG: hypothetical protein ACOX5Z_05590 [Desulfobulbus sp.]|jgi:hypothetical protein
MSELDDATVREAIEDRAADVVDDWDDPDESDKLDPEQLAGEIEERNRAMASLNDIILALVPVMNAFLEKEGRLLDQHRAAIKQTIRGHGDGQSSQQEDARGSSEPPPMPQLPDGIGMDLEQVAKLLVEKSRTIVSPDDPVLMIVTVLNAFLAEENKLMDQHKQALARVFADRLDDYIQGVKATADELGLLLADSTLAAQQRMLTGHRTTMIWTAAIVAISALVNVGVFVALYLLRG